MKHFLITIPDDKEILFIERMKSAKFIEKMEAVTSVGLPARQEEITAARMMNDRDESGDCCLTWEEIDQIIA